MGISPVFFWWKQECSDAKIQFIFSATAVSGLSSPFTASLSRGRTDFSDMLEEGLKKQLNVTGEAIFIFFRSIQKLKVSMFSPVFESTGSRGHLDEERSVRELSVCSALCWIPWRFPTPNLWVHVVSIFYGSALELRFECYNAKQFHTPKKWSIWVLPKVQVLSL